MTVYVGNLEVKTSDAVYNPAEDSLLLAKHVRGAKGRVLDVGTGTGIQAMVAAQTAEYVLGVDINPYAVSLAAENAKNNILKNIEIIESDLFDNVKRRFDLIVFNPPYLAVNELGQLAKSWSGGEDGVEVINRFLSGVSGYLEDEGQTLIVLSSVNKPDKVKDMLSQQGYKVEEVECERFFYERIYVVRFSL